MVQPEAIEKIYITQHEKMRDFRKKENRSSTYLRTCTKVTQDKNNHQLVIVSPRSGYMAKIWKRKVERFLVKRVIF